MAQSTTTSKKATTGRKRTPKEEGALMELFTDSLKDINWAEKQLVKALQKMAKAASSGDVSRAFEIIWPRPKSMWKGWSRSFNPWARNQPPKNVMQWKA